jgi:hypothetical protein
MSIVIRTFEHNSDGLFIKKYFGRLIPFLLLDRLTLLFHIFSSISSSPYTVKPVYNGQLWYPQKVAVVQRWPVFGGFSIKVGIRISQAGLSLAVADRWPLFRGGR